MSGDVCKQLVNRGDSRWSNFQECGRPVKENGLCGLHLSVRARREAKAAAWLAEQSRSDDLKMAAGRLTVALGVNVHPHFSSLSHKYDGRMVVPLAFLEEIERKTA